MGSASPPAIRRCVLDSCGIRSVRAASELGDGDIGNLGPVNLRHPLLYLSRIDIWYFVKCWPFCWVDRDCRHADKAGGPSVSRSFLYPRRPSPASKLVRIASQNTVRIAERAKSKNAEEYVAHITPQAYRLVERWRLAPLMELHQLHML